MLRPKNSNEEILLRKILKGRRKELGLTQEELARQLGLPQSFVSKYESGERVLAFTEVLILCRVLEVNLSSLEEEMMGN